MSDEKTEHHTIHSSLPTRNDADRHFFRASATNLKKIPGLDALDEE